MEDYTKVLPKHVEKYIGENDLFLEIFESEHLKTNEKRPPLLFVHGAYTGSWMWSKYIPHFVKAGWKCYVMNMRSHYKSRSFDLTKVTFEDYLEDIKEVVAQCGEMPIIIGFSMGGILIQKLAETIKFAGLVLIDSSICKEVYERIPYKELQDFIHVSVVPAPVREDYDSIDESANDIEFQKKYLSMESIVAFNAFVFSKTTTKGISVNNSLITSPCLVIKAVNSENDDERGRAEASHFNGEYTGLWHTTHTGLLVGQRYMEVVDRIMDWLKFI